jgi:sortase A
MNVTRSALRGAGELLITIGVVLLLFLAYQLWWTNLEAHRAQGRIADQIRDDWRNGPRQPTGPGSVGPVDFGKGFAFLRIPRLGKHFNVPVVQGTGDAELAEGVGHYVGTAIPGQVGNFAVAGHRATHGQPFAYLDQVEVGDALYVETARHWYTYIVDKTFLVDPTDVWVIDPVPGKPKAIPKKRLITLTTCDPRWGHTHRLIIEGHLMEARFRFNGAPPLRERA